MKRNVHVCLNNSIITNEHRCGNGGDRGYYMICELDHKPLSYPAFKGRNGFPAEYGISELPKKCPKKSDHIKQNFKDLKKKLDKI